MPCAVALRDTAVGRGLGMRTSVHTGEVDLIENDIREIAIHEASRILALAPASQILVSATTAALIRDAGIAVGDFGIHELRGIAESRQLYAIA